MRFPENSGQMTPFPSCPSNGADPEVSVNDIESLAHARRFYVMLGIIQFA